MKTNIKKYNQYETFDNDLKNHISSIEHSVNTFETDCSTVQTESGRKHLYKKYMALRFTCQHRIWVCENYPRFNIMQSKWFTNNDRNFIICTEIGLLYKKYYRYNLGYIAERAKLMKKTYSMFISRLDVAILSLQ